MIIALLLAILASLWILLRPPKQEWYVVECRSCDDEVLCPDTVPIPNKHFDKLHLDACELTIESVVGASATLRHKNGGTMILNQTLFRDFNAAIMFFEYYKGLIIGSRFPSNYEKLILRRVIARSRSKAFVLPPNSYDLEAVDLVRFPETHWHKK
ncbi:hypothetical protein K0B90_05825 [bacterium]|nr:hypothetical protein [bacterium]